MTILKFTTSFSLIKKLAVIIICILTIQVSSGQEVRLRFDGNSDDDNGHVTTDGTHEFGNLGGRQCGNFDYSSSGDRYLNVEAVDLGNSFTISGWVIKYGLQTYERCILSGPGSSFNINVNNTTLNFVTPGGTVSYYNFISSGSWAHFTAVVDKATGTCTLYKDGANPVSGTVSNSFNTSGTIKIGMNGSGSPLWGYLDDIQMYTCANLTSQQIETVRDGNTVTCGTTPPPTIPNAPGNLSATTVSESQISLSWADNSNDESGFYIERTQGASYTQIASVSSNVSSYSDAGLTASTTYTYRVRAYNTAGNSSYSNIDDATTSAASPTVPAAPSNLVLTIISHSEISLSWVDNSDNETQFNIQRSEGGAYADIANVTANTTSYTNSGLNPSTTYSYRVSATNSAGTSTFCTIQSATTDDEPQGGTSPWQSVTNGIYYSGNVGIGTTNPTARLTVDGSIHAEYLKIKSDVPQSDYVFESDYDLMTLSDLEFFITTNKHLPEIPSAKEFKENGYSVGQMDDVLLRKIEELTLYILELEKRLSELEK